MSVIAMPVSFEVPVGARLVGEAATVSLSVVAVVQCPHGHTFQELIPDASDAEAVAGRQAAWAAGHADLCTGAAPVQEAA